MFIHDDFLLRTRTARELYHTFAKDQPIIDFHCHLPPQDIAQNRQFANLYEIALEGDHYKWRAMRANGEDEAVCTGNATPEAKFQAFARTLPYLLRNPLYHWTHLELKRYFDLDTLLSEKTADKIWAEAHTQLQGDDLSVWGILRQFKVEVIGTTDDPIDTLIHHQAIAQSNCPAKVVPTFRPDKAMQFSQPADWNAWVDALAGLSNESCATLESFCTALDQRHAFFHELGGRASDHGLERCPERIATPAEASQTYVKARSGKLLDPAEAEGLAGYILRFIGELNAQRGWVMQLHLGAKRNVNSHIFQTLGRDKGCDSIGSYSQVDALATLLDDLSTAGKLPRVILYNLDPTENYRFATMCGNFFESGVAGKMQLGSGWWFLDQLEGMKWQLNTVSHLMLLRRFVGMLTDSRSFMSFPRHEYFRRLLCDLLGRDIEDGLIPDDHALCGALIEDICYRNARAYFQF